MESGFYVSPDGRHIIQLRQCTSWLFGFEVVGISLKWIDTLFVINKEDAKMVFSCWEYLGKSAKGRKE